MKSLWKRWSLISYVALSVGFLLFSYTQVDLNLTLSRFGLLHSVEQAFQRIGYYQRPAATAIFAAILSLSYLLYAWFLTRVKDGDAPQVWRVVLWVTAILVLSYPAALSYDFFNYMFTAKTVLVYHQNPYAVTPLQFAGIDPWTNFMRWTHLTTAYAPLWIGMTFVPFLLGLGIFVPVLFAMKAMVAAFYLISAYMVYRITRSGRALAVFALNPLILMESLISGHNDVVMVAFALIAVYCYERKDYWNAWMALAFSIAAKLMTVALLPVWFVRKGRIWYLGAMLLAVAAVLFKREFLPWYWVWVMPFAALTWENRKAVRFAGIVSFGLAASYAPYFYFGTYSQEEQLIKTVLIWTGVVAGTVSLVFPTPTSGKGV